MKWDFKMVVLIEWSGLNFAMVLHIGFTVHYFIVNATVYIWVKTNNMNKT